MDIWQWTYDKYDQLHENGHARLAEIMEELPSLSCGDQHERVDQLFPEGLALARAAGDKWVELFLRHWNLQSQVLSRCNANGMLEEAVALLDFAHQDETKGCPQRICAVQDLANCYGVKDGPGYFNERIDVSRETLEEITPDWPCYGCVGAELIAAYHDRKQHQQALQEATRLEAAALDNKDISDAFALTKARSLYSLERYQEGLKLLLATENHEGGLRFRREKRQILCKLYIALGDIEKAKENLLSFDEAWQASTYFLDWAENRLLFARGNYLEVTERDLLGILQMQAQLVEKGADRSSFLIAIYLAELACLADSYFVAQLAVKRAQEAKQKLVEDFGANQQLVEVVQKVDRMATHTSDMVLPDTEEEFEQTEWGSFNEKALVLQQAKQRWPENSVVAVEWALLLNEVGEDGEHYLASFAEDNPQDSIIDFYWGKMYLKKFGGEKFISAFPIPEQNNREQYLNRLWLHAHAHENICNSSAIDCLEKILEIDPDATNTLIKYAQLTQAAERNEASLASWKQLAKSKPDMNGYKWDWCLCAALMGNWQEAANAADALDIQWDKSKAINEQDWEYIRIQIEDDNETKRYMAERTGPVTARIISVANLENKQYYKASVIFNPAPLNELNEIDEEGNKCDAEGYNSFIYPLEKVLEIPEHGIFPIDGVLPEEEKINELIEKLHEQDIIFNQRSDQNYFIQNPEIKDQHLPGLYAYLLLQTNTDKQALSTLLSEFSSGLQHPLVWPELLEEIGDEQGLKQQLDISDRYGL